MPSNYAAAFEKRGGYIFDRNTIINLWKIANRFVGQDSTVTLDLLGGHTVEGSDIENVLDDLYVNSKRIVRLEISGHNNKIEPSRRVSISLKTKEAFLPVVNVKINGEREACTVTRTELENVIDGRAEWYSQFFLPIRLVPVLAWCAAVIIVSLLIAGALHTLFAGFPIRENRVHVAFVIEAIVLPGLFFALKDKMFPKVGFDIGQSSSVISSARIWRGVVFGGICIGLLVSVVGGLVIEGLK